MRQSKALFSVLKGKAIWPPPLWLMRQAGRYLPEYQKVRGNVESFWTMCMTPALAAEVTLQPIVRFGFDAAILFSDILVVPFALGQVVRFKDGVGPLLERFMGVEKLDRDVGRWMKRLAPVYEAVALTRMKLASERTLLGFAGGPWTLAAYMLEGHGSIDQRSAKLFAYRQPEAFAVLLEILSDCVIKHLAAQIEAGADAVQIFDSWAGGLPDRAFEAWVVAPTRRIVQALHASYPKAQVIGFPRAATESGYQLYMKETGVNAVSLDTAVSLPWAVTRLGRKVALQGNLDPLALVAGGAALDDAIDSILAATRNVPFIFNLGHGVLPETPVSNVTRLVERVRSG